MPVPPAMAAPIPRATANDPMKPTRTEVPRPPMAISITLPAGSLSGFSVAGMAVEQRFGGGRPVTGGTTREPGKASLSPDVCSTRDGEEIADGPRIPGRDDA